MPRKTLPHKAASPTHVDSHEQRKHDSRIEDSALIAAALRGENSSYKKLMGKYQPAILNYVSRMVHDRQQVEDLVQEAFIKAFSSLASFNDEYAFSTWLYKIVTNHCIDFIRKRKIIAFSIDKPIETKESSVSFELADEDAYADREIISKQKSQVLADAIAALPGKYRRVIHLRHTEERSYEEIATMLKLPIGTVKAHIFRAREMLYKALRDRIRHY